MVRTLDGSIARISSRAIWTYDLANRQLTETNGLNVTSTWTYDAAGRRLTKLDGNGQVTTFGYDDNGRRTSQTFSDGSKNEWGFDSRDNIILEKSPTHERHMQHDELGRLKQVDDVTLGRTIVYGYDSVGNRTSITEGGVTQRFTYDARNLLVAAQEGSSPPVQLKYDALGRRTAIIRPNGVRTDFAFDDVSQVTSITHSKGGVALLGFSYLYDSDGMRTRKTREDGSYEQYGFDTSRRLVSANYSNGRAISYGLDAWGNFQSVFDTSIPSSGAARTWRTNAFNQLFRIEGFTGVVADFTHDNNGNQLTEVAGPAGSGGTTTYAWTRGNRLSSVTKPSGVTSYQYDANGLRTRRVDVSGTVNYMLEGSSVLAEVDGGGGVTTRYLNNPQAVDDVFAHTSASGTVWPLTDALGSVYALTDSSGTIVRSQAFDVYGERTSSTGTGPSTDRGFTGREHDSWGGSHNRDRYYSPRTSNFLSPDRVRHVRGGRYSYAGSNPIAARDPSGTSLSFTFGGELYTAARSLLEEAYYELGETATGGKLILGLATAEQVTSVVEARIPQTPGYTTTGRNIGAVAPENCGANEYGVVVQLDVVAFREKIRNSRNANRPEPWPGGVLAHELGHSLALANSWPLLYLPPGQAVPEARPEGIALGIPTYQRVSCYAGCYAPCAAEEKFYSEIDPEGPQRLCSHKNPDSIDGCLRACFARQR